jgi:hypothetical protein
MARLKLSLLGPFSATVNEKLLTAFRTKAAQALLIYLTCEGEDAHRQTVGNSFWKRHRAQRGYG